MYDILSLDSKELDEIKEIAKQLNIPKPDKYTKQELIYKILDQQALNPSQELLDKEKKAVKKEFRPRRQRTPMKPRLAASTNLVPDHIIKKFDELTPKPVEKAPIQQEHIITKFNDYTAKISEDDSNTLPETPKVKVEEDQQNIPLNPPEPFEFGNGSEC